MILLQAARKTQNESNATVRKDMDVAPERKGGASQCRRMQLALAQYRKLRREKRDLVPAGRKDLWRGSEG
ncbi:hypothetical protein GCM10009085_29440 [Pseudomonas avellanae]|nr:hypothetical protein GCM10009085_29440 [Pseudomonas avellanae]